MSDIQPGDYVIPVDDDAGDFHGIDLSGVWTPCKVLNVYKNGNLRARSDDRKVLWHGPVTGFRKTDRR
ncbi:hypothetical protein SEA_REDWATTLEHOG_147 [Gordonia phage RedWattleHog]|uniref:Uncharacterized protein n=1 Tax=Gordonia phage Stormageddon TaxID=2656541 RepID=A0A649VRS6_9CAUD|nr:hypothetical protein KHQ86_gp152 [Gordonia phage Stormageddon]QGJ95008.1 hypothetical protein SEA_STORMAGEDDON_148 [Gordonia phage Stormageddon]QLF83650.1 hypothetical protein SEA_REDWATTLEHOG_147 [Gordonia phage RedWattleHog]